MKYIYLILILILEDNNNHDVFAAIETSQNNGRRLESFAEFVKDRLVMARLGHASCNIDSIQ